MADFDIDRLLSPISEEKPNGVDLEYDPDFLALEQAEKGKPEKIIGDSVIDAEPPNWSEVLQISERLFERTHDLRVCVSMCRALTAVDGYKGLSFGLELVFKLLSTHWEGLHPNLDDSDDFDPTMRCNIVVALNDRGGFIEMIRGIKLLESKACGSWTLGDVLAATQASLSGSAKPGAGDIRMFEAAVREAGSQYASDHMKYVKDSISLVGKIEEFFYTF